MQTIRDTQSLDKAITTAVAAARMKLMSMERDEQLRHTALRDARMERDERSAFVKNRPRTFPGTRLDFLDT